MDLSYDSVVDVIVTRFNLDPAAVSAHSTFDDLGLDSLSQVELATAIQKRLGVEITDEEMAELATVQDVAAAVRGKQVVG